MNKLYKKNLQLFTKQFGSNFKNELENCDISAFDIDIDKNNGTNIKVNGQKIYPFDAKASASLQVAEFKKNPKSYSMLPTTTHSKTDDIHDKYVTTIQDNSPAFDKDKNRFYDGLAMHHNQIPLMVMSSCGAGFHIEQLIKEFEIFNLIIYDEDLSFIKLSMSLIDWKPIIEYFSVKSRAISIVYHNDSEILANLALNAIKNINPMLATTIYFFGHLMNDFMKKVMEEILQEGYLLVMGWGFYDDEIISLENTIINTKDNYPIFSIDKPIDEFCDIPFFIVGSGPSIDNDIEFIKQNQNKAIICSAGTGISVLHSNGIKPDFHFEGERAPIKKDGKIIGLVGDILKDYSDNNYFDDVILAGLNVSYKNAFELFKNKFMFFRSRDCGSSIISNNITRFTITNPSVLNAVVSFSAILNFKSIYLFGTDSGFKDNTKHHSKDSFYYQKDHSSMRPDMFKTFEGNFGGKVFADEKLSWIKENIETIYRKKEKQSTVYNCSDGAKIKYTQPLRSSEIKLTKTYTKEQKREPFLSHIKTYEPNEIFINDPLNTIIPNVLRDIEILRQVCQKYVKTITVKELYIIIQAIFDYFDDKQEATKSLLKGTISVISAFAYMHTMASIDNEKNDKFVKFYLQTLIDFLDDVEQDLKDRFLQDK